MIQTNIIDEIETFFLNEIRIDAKYVHIQDKISGKKKEKTMMR